MTIAVPKEVQDNELRVGLTPEGARRLVAAGHAVVIEANAGEGAGFGDDEYRAAGAQIAPDAAAAWAGAEGRSGDEPLLLVKVKQPTQEECELFAPGSTFFGYTHTETRPWLVHAFLARAMTVISFERVRAADGSLPLLAPMSRIAGHMSVLIGAQLLQTVHGGPGVMLGGPSGPDASPVVIIGGGTVGEWAARTATGMGARATVFELRQQRRAELARALPGVSVLAPDPLAVAQAVAEAWLVINAATVPAHSQVHEVTREMVRAMRRGALIMDVTGDLGGAIETSVRHTTHSQPTYVEEGVRHYVVLNIPGVVPRSSTVALETATLPYMLRIAELGVAEALAADPGLAAGLLCREGQPVAEDVAAMARK
ncbi:MAG: alanine dehydrogenase [Armatimonadota bacterium]